MSLKFRGNSVGVEKLKKQGKQNNVLFAEPEQEEYRGIVRYVGEKVSADIAIGAKVFFYTKFQPFRIDGTDLCVMEDSNIVAVVQDDVAKDS